MRAVRGLSFAAYIRGTDMTYVADSRHRKDNMAGILAVVGLCTRGGSERAVRGVGPPTHLYRVGRNCASQAADMPGLSSASCCGTQTMSPPPPPSETGPAASGSPPTGFLRPCQS